MSIFEQLIDFVAYLGATLIMMWFAWVPIFVGLSLLASMATGAKSDAEFQSVANVTFWVATAIVFGIFGYLFRKANGKNQT